MMGRWDGTTLHRDPTPSPSFSSTDIVAFSPTSALALGFNAIVQWNGTTWTSHAPAGLPSSGRTAITGRSVDDFYVFTDNGNVYGCNLTQCTLLKQLPSAVRIARIVGNKGLAVGDDGLVVYGSVIGN
jgi:hypothetical protein